MMMKKAQYVFKEMVYLIKKHKVAFLTPILIVLILMVFLVVLCRPCHSHNIYLCGDLKSLFIGRVRIRGYIRR